VKIGNNLERKNTFDPMDHPEKVAQMKQDFGPLDSNLDVLNSLDN